MPKTLAGTIAAAIASLSLTACGSSGATPTSATQVIGAGGGTIQVGSSALSIPAGALGAPTQVTIREAEPHHAGRAVRIEIEPGGTKLAVPAQVAVKVDDTNVHVKMHDDADDLVDVEVEDANHGKFKTSVTELGAVEVEVEHGLACTPACAASEECDDGVCKAHAEDATARTCTPVCATGLECDDGVCKVHGGAH